jgi:NTE family protein
MRLPSLVLVILLSYEAHAQKIGLVLSGGGAKGIAHIGVLKALEENEIPIDYIVGTSMGGIVAGCYAAGLSPGQIETMILSDEFLRWVNGKKEDGYRSFFYSHEANPGFITLSLSLDSAFNAQVNTSIANDVTLNFALAEKMAQAEAIANENFDSLFVPIRVMAADVFSQKQVVLSGGSLSKALRATQTVPFFYTPIRIDGKYLFDGGVYNNFPVDVMQRQFAPDVIIGSNVSSKIFDEYPFEQDDELLNNSMLFMFLDKSDPEDVPASGVYIQPDLRGYSAIDFEKARQLIDSGYVQTLRKIEEVRQKVTNRTRVSTVADRRNAFNRKGFSFTFDEIKFNLYNSKQRKYLTELFGFPTKKEPEIGVEEVKRRYFNFVSEEYFSNTYPSISFNQQRRKFVLELTRRKQQNFQLQFGGVISTRDVSNIFAAANFFYFNKQLVHGYAGFHSGSFYKSGVAQVRIDYPYLGRFYLEPSFTFNNWNYAANADLLGENPPTVLNRIDRDFSLRMGWPITDENKIVAQIGGISNRDNYINTNEFTSTNTLDELKLKGLKTGVSLSADNLNRKQYASSGGAYQLSAWYFNADEYHVPGNTSDRTDDRLVNHHWFTARVKLEKYFNKGWFRPGFLVEAAYTTLPNLTNFQGTLINAPSFNPLPDSRTLFLEKFRAKSFVAGGGRVVISPTSKIDWRVEGYLFKPFQSLQQTTSQGTAIDTELLEISLAATTSLVYHSPIGPISLMCNYYDDKENPFGVFMHVGYLLFNRPSIE